ELGHGHVPDEPDGSARVREEKHRPFSTFSSRTQPGPRMKVLVTGALGNVGSYTVDALVEEGHVVVAFDVESPRARRLASRLDTRVHVVWGDITDPASIRAALEGVGAVVHLAGILPPKVDRAPDLARRINVDGTRSLIEQMESSGT